MAVLLYSDISKCKNQKCKDFLINFLHELGNFKQKKNHTFDFYIFDFYILNCQSKATQLLFNQSIFKSAPIRSTLKSASVLRAVHY